MQKPSQSEIQKQTNAAIQDYVNTDLAAVITKARNSGDTNRLGLAYVKAGRFADAKAEFTKGANAGKLSSIINLANVYVLEKNYSAAHFNNFSFPQLVCSGL